VTVAGSSTPAPSAITVSGRTVSWPDDGWYQLQTEDGSRSVCEGGTSCDVDPGRYVLINHSTGERFPDIVVTGGSTPPTTEPPVTDSITVTGNVIRWPDDGWYQVQTADGSSNVCSGGTSCEVSDGTYLLINHTTGERFNNIVVGGSTPPVSPPVVTPPSGVDSVTVVGTTISWPDNGWYQIQNAETFATICEVVINHSDGSRQTVRVEGTGGGTTPPVGTGSETVQVNFDITVPALVSNALQVNVLWGDTALTAAWLIDESWSVTGELPANTEQPLSIFFYDDNGAITLASIETMMRMAPATLKNCALVATLSLLT